MFFEFLFFFKIYIVFYCKNVWFSLMDGFKGDLAASFIRFTFRISLLVFIRFVFLIYSLGWFNFFYSGVVRILCKRKSLEYFMEYSVCLIYEYNLN